jgi:hypothetical protein
MFRKETDCPFFHEFDGQCCADGEDCVCRPTATERMYALNAESAREVRHSEMLFLAGVAFLAIVLAGLTFFSGHLDDVLIALNQ